MRSLEGVEFLKHYVGSSYLSMTTVRRLSYMQVIYYTRNLYMEVTFVYIDGNTAGKFLLPQQAEHKCLLFYIVCLVEYLFHSIMWR